MYQLTSVYGDLGFWFFADSRMLLGTGLPLISLSITNVSYDGIARDKTDQASALINAARNISSSIGVSLISNVIAHREVGAIGNRTLRASLRTLLRITGSHHSR